MLVNQLSSVEIDFDDEVYAVILLMPLPDNWEPMRVVVSNSVHNVKLNFNNIKDQVLVKEICRIDLSKVLTLSFALNLKSRVIRNDKNSNRNKGRSKLRNGRSILDLGRM